MQFKFDPKVLMPHLVAVTLFYLLPLFYFSPVTQGYSIIQGDISSFKGMAKSYVDHRETYNEEALWTDAMFSGMPAYQVAVGYFSNVLRYIDRFISIHLFWEGPHLLLFLCMVSFYILCITLSINPWLSIAGAIGFGFSSYFPILIEAGHNAKLHAIAYLPGALAGFLMVLRGNFIRGGVLFGCFMSLEILSNHIQVTYYFGLMLAIFLAFYGYDLLKQGERQRLIRALMVLIAAGSLAVLSNAAILWNTYRYAQETMRGGSALTILPGGIKNTNKTSGLDLDYLTQWSQGISETWSLLIPEVKGGGSGPIEYARGRQTNAYWGEQPFTSGPVYAGAFLVFLFLLGFFVLSGPYRWAALVSSLFFLMIAWLINRIWFTQLLADYLPMYNMFRTPSMALLILELLIPLSAVMVLSRLGNVGDFFKQKQIRKPVLYTTGILVAILLLVGMSPDSFFDLVN
ncbi:MAG: hypothetical protein KDC37_04205, partial [Flavobacteriales bacterium]|nr:hypothetical protein [Flavobacteriales bacterium]